MGRRAFIETKRRGPFSAATLMTMRIPRGDKSRSSVFYSFQVIDKILLIRDTDEGTVLKLWTNACPIYQLTQICRANLQVLPHVPKGT